MRWRSIPVALSEAPRKIVANLPYNIATALLLRWLDRIGAYESLTLMFQREVAERLVAAPRSPAYGRLSVLVQWLTEPKILFDLPPRAFVPPPKVTSSVVMLTPRAAPLAPAAKPILERVTAAAFGQRRKMLRSSLKPLGVPVDELLAAAGIPPTARAEELSVAEFCALARILDDRDPNPASPSPQSVDEFGEAELALAAAALGGNDRGDFCDAFVDVAIDDHVIVFRPVAHFLGRFRHPRGDGFGAVLRAALEPIAQCRDARRQHEYLDQILRHRLAQLLRPLPVDIGHDVAAGGERRLDRPPRRPVRVAENGRVFEQLSGRHHRANCA